VLSGKREEETSQEKDEKDEKDVGLFSSKSVSEVKWGRKG
jgi:hypothetical protein